MKNAHYTRAALALATLGGLILSATPLYAQDKITSYTDVSAGAWYESAAKDLLDIGALAPNEAQLRPNDMATRAEMVKLMVRVNNQALSYPALPSFSDVSKLSWYFPYFEASARLGWVRGDNNCYGSKPCYARPDNRLNRAEAASLLVRAFSMPSTGGAPVFPDNTNNSQWYYSAIQIAADHCVLQGDDQTSRVRPASNMNRAEMVVMFDRAYKNQRYGTDCSTTQANNTDISSATALTSRKLRLVFSSDLDGTMADDAFRYAVATLAGDGVTVAAATTINARTVELTLAGDLTNRVYRVTGTNLHTSEGVSFNADKTFSVDISNAVMTNATATAADHIRIVFNSAIDSSTANDAFRYTIRETANYGMTVGIQSATVIDAHTVDLALSSSLKTGVSYTAVVSSMMTTDGKEFNDDAILLFSEPVAHLNSLVTTSSTSLRLTFSTDIDRQSAEAISSYRVSSYNRDIAVSYARYVDSKTVDLILNESFLNQHGYSVLAVGVRTLGNVAFTDSGTTVYNISTVTLKTTLLGAREVPSVTTTMTGSGTFRLSSTGLEYDIQILNPDGSTITAAHFHRGAVGSNGSVVQSISTTGTHFTGTWTHLSAADRNDLLMGNFYVNVHTQGHPDGEIRGQLAVQ